MMGKILYWDLRGWPLRPIDVIRERSWEYALVRRHRPRVMIETGVLRGGSSALFLSAMERNGTGRLISVEKPRYRPEMNADGKAATAHVGSASEVGALVPPRLRHRWTLVLEDARTALPRILSEIAAAGEQLELFYHDSDHTYEQMLFEYRTAWAAMKSGGIVASDDINWNEAFSDFAKEVGVTPLPSTVAHRGLVRKP
jgi:predicted O-methyltransferase YrrM